MHAGQGRGRLRGHSRTLKGERHGGGSNDRHRYRARKSQVARPTFLSPLNLDRVDPRASFAATTHTPKDKSQSRRHHPFHRHRTSNIVQPPRQHHQHPTMPTPADTLIVVLLVLLPVLYYYRDTLPLIGKPAKSGDRASVNGVNGKKKEDEGDPRDWLEQMQRAVSISAFCSW